MLEPLRARDQPLDDRAAVERCPRLRCARRGRWARVVRLSRVVRLPRGVRELRGVPQLRGRGEARERRAQLDPGVAAAHADQPQRDGKRPAPGDVRLDPNPSAGHFGGQPRPRKLGDDPVPLVPESDVRFVVRGGPGDRRRGDRAGGERDGGKRRGGGHDGGERATRAAEHEGADRGRSGRPSNRRGDHGSLPGLSRAGPSRRASSILTRRSWPLGDTLRRHGAFPAPNPRTPPSRGARRARPPASRRHTRIPEAGLPRARARSCAAAPTACSRRGRRGGRESCRRSRSRRHQGRVARWNHKRAPAQRRVHRASGPPRCAPACADLGPWSRLVRVALLKQDATPAEAIRRLRALRPCDRPGS